MRNDDHANPFFSSGQLQKSVKTVVMVTDKVDEYEGVGANNTREIPVFRYEKKAFVYVQIPGTHSSYPFLKILEHMSVVDSVFNFYREGISNRIQAQGGLLPGLGPSSVAIF